MEKKTHRKYLLLVEGEKAEVEIFSAVLGKYGYKVNRNLRKLDFKGTGDPLGPDVFSSEESDVYILSGKQTRLRDVVNCFDPKTDFFERALGFRASDIFQGIFLIYDVDHNESEVLEKAFSRFDSEDKGLLLLECPCLEVLGDDEVDPIPERKMERPSKDYKPELNKYHERVHGCSTVEYIKENFERLALRFLVQNHEDFSSSDVMEHPGLVIKKINEMNERSNEKDSVYCVYRYYTTVVYVFLAYIKGLTREIDNYEAVKRFFEAA